MSKKRRGLGSSLSEMYISNWYPITLFHFPQEFFFQEKLMKHIAIRTKNIIRDGRAVSKLWTRNFCIHVYVRVCRVRMHAFCLPLCSRPVLQKQDCNPPSSVLSLLDCAVHWNLGCVHEQFLSLRASHMYMKCMCVLSSARTQEGNHDSRGRQGFEVTQRWFLTL